MQLNSMDARVQQMFSLLLDSSAKDSDQQKVTVVPKAEVLSYCIICYFFIVLCLWCFLCVQAAQNLVVLSREDAGAEQIFRNDGVKLIQRLLQSKQEEIVLSALRTLVGLCTGHQSRVSMAVLREVVY